MYKNAKLYAVSLGELVAKSNDAWRVKQTMHYRNGAIQKEPFVERGDKIDDRDLEDLAQAYRSGRLYFRI